MELFGSGRALIESDSFKAVLTITIHHLSLSRLSQLSFVTIDHTSVLFTRSHCMDLRKGSGWFG
uniref:Uncharacterized protein n=1 Tax=Anguilla anguilla TaxID=7936 RepID=A0A0E9Q2S3_ANGAN